MSMSAASIQQSRIRPGSVDPALWLGLLFGVALPLAMAEMFFTYVAVLQTVWLERAKLLELPIVAGEVLVIAWAFRQGFDRQVLWAALSRDIRWALMALFGALAVSSLLSTMPLEASLQSLIVVVHLYFAAAVYFLAARAPAFARGETFIAGLAWGLVPIALLTVVRFQFPPPLSEIPGGRIDWVFALPGFISVRYFGTWTGAVAAALAVGILHRGVAELRRGHGKGSTRSRSG
jgi:hypothetical protein